MSTAPPAPWKEALAASATRAEDLPVALAPDPAAIARVAGHFPMLVNPYFLSLITRPHDPLWKQAVPSEEELSDNGASEDPLCEKSFSPVPGILHRYPDRVVFLAESRCAVFCRHCTRKRLAGRGPAPDHGQAIEYIRNTPAVREVVLSGGDPLLLDDNALFNLMESLARVPHVEVLRVHTRVPGALPQRITPDLARGLARFCPVYVNIQFNHPAEITPQAAEACALLADAGIPLGSQTVLLAGVNDNATVLKELFRSLLRIRVRPYYLHQLDRVRGTAHFEVPLHRGLSIMEELRGHISGMAVPHFMVDLPGGGGKVPCLPQYFLSGKNGARVARNFQGKIFSYRS